LRLAVLALAVFGLAYVCIEWPKRAGQVAPIWLPNAVVLATLLCSRRRRWPLIAAVGALALLATNFAVGYRPGMGFGLAAANAFEICTSAIFLSRLARRPFERWRARDCLYFGAVVLLASCVSALMALTVLWLETSTPLGVRDYLMWAGADALGMLILTPCLLILARSRTALRSMGKEAILPFVVLVAAATLSFGQNRYPIQFLPACALIFVAWRLRITGAAIGLLVLDAIAIPLTMAGRGTFAYTGNHLREPILALQTYMAVCFFLAVPVSAQSQRVRRLHSKLRQALGEAREDARKVSMAGEVAMLGYWRFETATGKLNWSSQMYRMFGLDPAEAPDMEQAMSLVHPADRDRAESNFKNAIVSGEGYVQDIMRIVTPQGELRYVSGRAVVEKDAAGVVNAVFGVYYDKTDSSRAERARKEAESRYKLLAENASDLIMQTGLDRRFSYVSPSVEAITGYTQAEVVGQSPLLLLDPRDADPVSNAFDEQIDSKGRTEPFRIEYRIQSKDGREVWLESRPTALIDPVTGDCLGVSDVARDITARRALEDELRAAREAAEGAARVKGEFLANMSHELRTPLTSVVGFTRLAAEQPDMTPLTRGYVERVSEASRALLCTVNDILDFSKLEAGQVTIQREPTSPYRLLRGALDLFLPQAAAKDLDLVLECAADQDLCLDLDPDRIRQVMLNLIGNAVKFTDQGSVAVRLGYEDGQLIVSIADTGPGIAPERIGQLFQRFSQIDGSLTRSHGGTGLGLAICKGLVEAMGGEISALSTLGQGSTFEYRIPAAAVQAPVRLEGAAVATVETMAPGLRVLVVDDHQANRELATLFLAGIGAEVFEAADGPEAVDIASQWPFDVILMDLRMPKMDGATALAAIRGVAGPNDSVPVLAFTADADVTSAERLAEYGFQGVVSKPVEPAALIGAVLAAVSFEPAAALAAEAEVQPEPIAHAG
jgi:PAS domain S-box-containing protein